MDGLILDKGINGTEIEELDAGKWLAKLIEAIREDLLSTEDIKALLDNPYDFLVEYTDSKSIAYEVHNRIVQLFFVQMMEMKERKKNKRKVLIDLALDKLDDKLTDTDSISAVDWSQIYKNLKD